MEGKPDNEVEQEAAKFVLSGRAAADRALRALSKVCAVHATHAQELTDTYLDDAEGHLQAHGLAVRMRRRGTAELPELWSLESEPLVPPTAGARHQEVSQPLSGAPDIAALPEGPVLEMVKAHCKGPLVVLFELYTQRDRYVIEAANGAEIELAIDRTLVVDRDDQVVENFEEVAFELKSGDAEDLHRLLKALAQHVQLNRSQFSGFARGIWAAKIHRFPRRPVLQAKDSAVLLVSSQLNIALAKIEHHLGVALEGQKPDALRQLRANVRRVRSALRYARPLLDAEGRAFEPRFKEFSRAVGGVRDLDVLLDRLHLRLAGMSQVDERAQDLLLSRIRAERCIAERNARIALTSAPKLIRQFRLYLETGLPEEWPSAQKFGRRLIQKRARRLRKRGRRVRQDSANQTLHTMRLEAKRLRYALELLRPLHGRDLKRYERVCRDVQDAFGVHQDACVTIGLLTRLAAEMPSDGASGKSLVLLGRLLQDQHVLEAEAREEALRTWRSCRRFVSAAELKGAMRR